MAGMLRRAGPAGQRQVSSASPHYPRHQPRPHPSRPRGTGRTAAGPWPAGRRSAFLAQIRGVKPLSAGTFRSRRTLRTITAWLVGIRPTRFGCLGCLPHQLVEVRPSGLRRWIQVSKHLVESVAKRLYLAQRPLELVGLPVGISVEIPRLGQPADLLCERIASRGLMKATFGCSMVHFGSSR
jgi:hypothetical protein